MRKYTLMIITGLMGAALFLGCAKTKPFDYHPGNEIPEGPGLFSKEKGEFTIYSDKETKAPAHKKESLQEASGKAPGPVEPSAALPADSSEEFRQFKQWQQEQKEFEAFQQWKNSAEGAKEYQDFQEWKRWKAYKQWQESQQKDR